MTEEQRNKIRGCTNILQITGSDEKVFIECGDLTKKEIEILKEIYGPNARIAKYKDKTSDDFELYSLEDYEKIHKKIERLVSTVSKEDEELLKFSKIYQAIGMNIVYDRKATSSQERSIFRKNREYAKENSASSRNMENALMKQKTVCAGLASTLQNALTEVGMESKIISNDRHAWNAVMIDGNWYHVDITMDLDNIKMGSKPQYVLLSDEEIERKRHHKIKEGTDRVCNIKANKELKEKLIGYLNSSIEYVPDISKEEGYVKLGRIAKLRTAWRKPKHPQLEKGKELRNDSLKEIRYSNLSSDEKEKILEEQLQKVEEIKGAIIGERDNREDRDGKN